MKHQDTLSASLSQFQKFTYLLLCLSFCKKLLNLKINQSAYISIILLHQFTRKDGKGKSLFSIPETENSTERKRAQQWLGNMGRARYINL